MAAKEYAYKDFPHFVNSRGEHIYCKYWQPQFSNETPKVPSALVFTVHGYLEHLGWYEWIGDRLSKIGCLVCGHDHVGHGRSEGSRAYVSNFDFYVDDLMQHIGMMRETYPTVPIFLFGHSMGGTIILKAILYKPDLFRGIILSAPLVVQNPESASTIKVAAAKMLASIWSRCPVAKINNDWLSKDKQMVKEYNADPLVYHGAVKAGWGVAALKALDEIQPRLHQVELPMLTIHGDADVLCEITGSKMLQNLANSTDKTFSIYPGAYHKVFTELDGTGEKCIEEIVTWVNDRLTKPGNGKDANENE